MPHKDPEQRRISQKAYRLRNAEKARAWRKKWEDAHPDAVKAKKLRWLAAHPEQVRAMKRSWHHRVGKHRLIPGKEAERQRTWRLSKGDVYRAAHAAYVRRRYRTDPAFNLLCRLRSRIRCALQNQSLRKGTRTAKLLGCTGSDLVAHLAAQFTPGMTVEMLLDGRIHVDHKLPCASFDLSIPEQAARCFHYTNLVPLWAYDNARKSDKLPSGCRARQKRSTWPITRDNASCA